MKTKSSITLRQLLRYILDIARPFYHYLGIVFVLVSIEAIILAYFIPEVIQTLTDITEASHNKVSLLKQLTAPLVFFFVLQCVLEVNLRLQDYFFSIKTVPKLTRNIYNKQINKLLGQSYQFYQYHPAGVLSNNLTRLVNSIPDILESFVLKITFFILTFLVAIVSLWQVIHFAGICFIIYFCFISVVVAFFNKRINTLTVGWTSKRARVVARMLDIMTNIFTIKLFSSRKREKKALYRMNNGMWQAEKRVEYAYLTMSACLGMGYLLLQGLSMYVLLGKAAAGLISIGALMKVMYLNETVVSLVWDDLPDLLQFSKQLGKAKQALSLEYVPVQVKDKPAAKDMTITEGSITFERVTFAFAEDEKPFFRDLSLHVPAGQRVGIVGYTGSGKSTLIKLLLRLYDIQGGRISIDGQDIAYVTQDSLRRQVGLIPQDISLLARSIRENLHYGQAHRDEAKMVAAAKQTIIHDFIMSTENGYDSLVGEEGILLSGGERQRLNAARLLLRNPAIVLLDEATSQLDAITERSLNTTLNEFMQGKTTIVIAHRMSTLLTMDRLLVMDKGKIVEDGTHEGLLAKKGLYAHFWRTQVDGFIQTEAA